MGCYENQEKKKPNRSNADEDDESVIEGESILKKVELKAVDA